MKLRNKYVILAMVVIMLALSGMVLAMSGMNPITHYSGHGDPLSGTFREGDLYTDLDTRSIWVFINHTWSRFATLGAPQGSQGETGPAGIDGINGTSGINGINGTNGIDGANGINGNTWLWNRIDPTSDVGNDGDLYLNFATWDVFGKTHGIWSLLGNIKGEQGITGIDGTNGTDGLKGVNGTDGADVTDGANGTNGVDTKDGINGTDGTNGTNGLNGIDGINGLNITDGKDGTTGITGAYPWWTIALLGGAGGTAVATSVYAVRKKNEARADARKVKILRSILEAKKPLSS